MGFELENITDSNFELQLLELLKIQVYKYNGFTSSSISMDKAKSIMESNIYTIELYLKKFEQYEAIKKLQTENFCDMYNKGRKLIDKKISLCKFWYHKVLNNLIDTSNETYNLTIVEGIKGFFKIYDPDYNAKDIKITADYPLYNNLVGKLYGIEFIEKYLEYIYYENAFCNIFPKENVKIFLNSYSKDFSHLIINIFQIMLIQAIGCILANESYMNLNVSFEGIKRIYNCFTKRSKKEIYNLIFNAYSKIEINNKEISEYIEKGIEEIQSEIYNNYILNNLDKIFITQKFFQGGQL